MGRPRIDMAGQRIFGLMATGETKQKGRELLWECLCDCGSITFFSGSALRSGKVKGCGCGRGRMKTHGMTGTRLYNIWAGMKDRCLNKKATDYIYYGGRGITVCEGWMDSAAFFEWAVNNGYQDNLTIERKDNNAGYSPENCCFIPFPEQATNQRKTRIAYVDGLKLSLRQAAKMTGIPYHRLLNKHKKTGSIKL